MVDIKASNKLNPPVFHWITDDARRLPERIYVLLAIFLKSWLSCGMNDATTCNPNYKSVRD